jgi:site-specific DNA recombinase
MEIPSHDLHHYGGADAAEEAGYLIQQLPDLWAEATPGERRQLLLTMLDTVYVDAKEERRIVALKPKLAFKVCSRSPLRKKEMA